MLDQFSRTRLLLGEDAMLRLFSARVAVFGLGGVGSYAAEALARSGVAHLGLYDDDVVCLTNINRQLIATRKTVGQPKTEAMLERVLAVNPKISAECFRMFYGKDTADAVDLSAYDYVLDAIDTVSSKLLLVERAAVAGVPIISCMGAGNKLDATRFEVADIYQTSVCPLARVMRSELRKRGIASLKVVYSKEAPLTPIEDGASDCKKHCICPPGTQRKCTIRRQVPGSTAFVPPVAGLIAAGEIVKDLCKG